MARGFRSLNASQDRSKKKNARIGRKETQGLEGAKREERGKIQRNKKSENSLPGGYGRLGTKDLGAERWLQGVIVIERKRSQREEKRKLLSTPPEFGSAFRVMGGKSD